MKLHDGIKINTRAKLTLLTFLGVLASALSFSVFAETYDVVINNGRVMDPETLYDDIANVGIKDGRIAEISKKPLKSVKTIDASGHIVAPGFIDTHFHWQTPIGYRVGLRDGMTSAMDFEAGCAGSLISSVVVREPQKSFTE